MKVVNRLLVFVSFWSICLRLQASSPLEDPTDRICSTVIIRRSKDVHKAILAALHQWSDKSFTLYDKGTRLKIPRTLSDTARGCYEFRFAGILTEKMRVIVFRDIGSVGTTTRILLVSKFGSKWRVTGELSMGADIHTLEDLRSVLRCGKAK